MAYGVRYVYLNGALALQSLFRFSLGLSSFLAANLSLFAFLIAY